MPTLFRLLAAEAVKFRRSPALRLVWVLPAAFIALDFFLFERSLLRSSGLTPEQRLALPTLPIRAVSIIWAGFFHPLLLAILPALILRPEHRFKQWKHLHAAPVSRQSLFLAKALTLFLVSGVILGLATLGLRAEWALLSRLKPSLTVTFPWMAVAGVMAWLFLGSLPLLGLYLWLADRVSSAVVPAMLGLTGLMLTISLGGQELYPLWKRDLIPWVLPYTCAQRAITAPEARQDAHAASIPFRKNEPSRLPRGQEVVVVPLPNGQSVRIVSPAPAPPPAPTPSGVLVVFSLGVGALMLGLGFVEAGRDRP